MEKKDIATEERSGGNNGFCSLKNHHLRSLASDHLYHLGFDTKVHDFEQMFGDVKFVCVGGSSRRMKHFAEYISVELSSFCQTVDLIDLTVKDRYSMFKVGPVLSVSHGIGVSSLSVLLDELFKLLHYAKCTDVVLIRLGTSGGIGVQPGTVVITNNAVDGLLRPYYEQYILGEVVRQQATIDQDLVNELKVIAEEEFTHFNVTTGGTLCAHSFYEGQARLDGAVCEYTEAEKASFIRRLYDNEIRNIDMESVCLVAKCNLVNVKCAIVCVALLDRLKGDQVLVTPDLYKEYEMRPQQLVALFIKRRLQRKFNL